MVNYKNKIDIISKQIESELNNVLNSKFSEQIQSEIISNIEEYYKIEIGKLEEEIYDLENININSILNELEQRYEIKLNNNLSLSKINDYIKQITDTIECKKTKLNLKSSIYKEDYIREIKNNKIEDLQLIDIAQVINKKENFKLLESLDNKKWWSISYWINKPKIRKQEEINKLEYKSRENEIVEILKGYKEITIDSLKDISYIKDIVDEEVYINIKNLFKANECIEISLYKILNILNEYKVRIDNLVKRTNDIQNYKISEIYETIAKDYEDIIDNQKELQKQDSIINKEKISENHIKNDMLIKSYFYENTYNLFVKYCENQGFKYMNDILNFNFDILLQERGFGVGKIKKLKEKYELYISENNIYIDKSNVETSPDYININEYFKNKDISILEVFDVKIGVIEKLKKEIQTIDELSKKSKANISKIDGVGKTKVDDIYDALELLSREPKEVFNKILLDIKSDKNFDILKKRAENKTLQEVGIEIGVTRERIRQLEAKLVDRLAMTIDIFDQYIINEIGSKKIIDELDLKNIIEDTSMLSVILNYIKKDICTKFKYFDEIKKVIIDIDEDNLRDKLYEIAEELDEIFNINDEQIDIDEILLEEEITYISKDDFINFLVNIGYKRKGNYLIKGQVNKGRVYSYIVKEFFKDGIRFNLEDDMNKLKYILEHDFNMLDEEESERAIRANIERTCILRNTSTYTHPDNVDVDTNILRKIKTYIDENQSNTLYITDIYEEFKYELNKKSGIDTKEYLHGVFKYFYGEYYSFTRDTIYKGEEKSTSGEMIESYIKSKNRFVTKSELKQQFKGWTEIMFIVAIENNKNILQWDHNKYILMDNLYITKEDKRIINEILRLDIIERNGYTNANIIFEIIKSKYPEFLKKNNIKVAYSLYSIIKYLFEDEYRFKRMNIALNELDIELTNIGILKYMLKDRIEFTKDEAHNICKALKMKESTRHATVEELLSQCKQLNDQYVLCK